MTEHLENGADHSIFALSTRAHVADLRPESGDLSNLYIEAAVALIWPYSSSTRQLSFLLAERDVQLRKSKGQVKVTFHNDCARAVARSRVGIGDTVRLGLYEVLWKSSSNQISTPGKKVDWDLHVRNRVGLEVTQDSETPVVIDFRPANIPSDTLNGAPSHTDTPRTNGAIEVNSRILPDSSSPFVRTPARISSSVYKESAADPFANDEESPNNRARKRTKFGRYSGAWRLADELDEENQSFEHTSPTRTSFVKEPVRENFGSQVIKLPTETIDLTEDANDVPPRPRMEGNTANVKDETALRERQNGIVDSSMGLMAPPPKTGVESNQMTSPVTSQEVEIESSPRASTPRLMPLASPGLALVSPLVTRSGYFSNIYEQISELEQAGQHLVQSEKLQQEEQEFPLSSVFGREFGAPASSNQLRQDVGTWHPRFLDPVARDDPVDLDFLEGEIEKDASQRTAELQDVEVIEDDDLYGPPVIRQLSQPGESVEEYTILSQSSPLTRDLQARDDIDERVASSRHDSENSVVVVRDVVTATTAQDTDFAEDVPQQQSNRKSSEVSSQQSFSLDGSHDEQQLQIIQSKLPDEKAGETPPEADLQTSPPLEVGAAQGRLQGPLTPEATQNPPTDLAQSRISIQNESGLELLPLTPVESQEPMNQQQSPQITTRHDEQEEMMKQIGTSLPFKEPLVETEAAGDLSGLPEVSFLQDKDARRTSRRLLRKPVLSDEITSEYFTPRKTVQAAKSSSLARKENVPLSHTVNTLSSSPHDVTPLQLSGAGLMKENNIIQNVQPTTTPKASARYSRAGVTTSLSYYPSLASLSDHFNQNVDVLALCTSDSTRIERAKTGPKDYHTTLHLVDSSFPDKNNTTITGQLFRPRKNALPTTRRGDIMLMRDFKVQTQDHKPMLLSTDSSAWMVFRGNSSSSSFETLMNGPPIEFGPMEEAHARHLLRWWATEGEEKYPNLPVDTMSGHEGNQSPLGSSPTAQPSTQARPKPPPLRLGAPNAMRRKNNRTDNMGSEMDQQLSPQPTDTAATTSQLLDGSLQQSVEQYSPVSPTLTMTTATPTTREFARPFTRSMRAESTVSDLPSPALTMHSAVSASVPTSISAIPPLQSTSANPGDAQSLVAGSKTTAKHKRGGSIGGQSMRSTRSTRRSESVVHELRDGTTYIDEVSADIEGGSGANGEATSAGGILESRSAQVSGAATTIAQPPRRSARNRPETNNSMVHELRDGAKYIDG